MHEHKKIFLQHQLYYGISNDKCYHRGVFSHLATVSVRLRSSNSLPYTQEWPTKKQNKTKNIKSIKMIYLTHIIVILLLSFIYLPNELPTEWTLISLALSLKHFNVFVKVVPLYRNNFKNLISKPFHKLH